MKYVLIALIVLIVLGAGALLAAMEYFFRFAVLRKKAPRKRKKSLSESKGLTELAPFKEQMRQAEAWLRAQPMEEVSILSHDGLKLAGRLLDAGTKRTLILFHGYRASAYRDFSCVAEYYKSLGFNLLLIDQRAHGLSEGRFITFGVKERFDCVRWTEYIDGRIGGDIFLDGLSMGATTVLMASGEKMPESVRGIIADCGFTSPEEIMVKVMTVDLKIPKEPLFRPVAWMIKKRAGFAVNEYSTLEAMKHNKLPILFLHGKADKFVPYEMTVRACEACRSEKELLLVENASHGISYLVEPERCKAALEKFLKKYSREEA